MLVCVDYLVESGEITYMSNENVMSQNKVYIINKNKIF